MSNDQLKQDSSISHLFTNQFGERFLYEVNGSVFNVTGSETVYNKFFGEGLFQDDTLYVILGSDSGLLVKYIEKTGVPEGSRYLIIEDEQILSALHSHNVFEDMHARIKVCTLEDWKSARQELGIDKYIFAETVHLIKSIGARDSIYAPYSELYIELENQYRNYAWGLLNKVKLMQFMNRQLDNVAENHTPFIKLRGFYKGKTCAILAGGPSLDESIDWVKKNQKDIIIIAVSRIAKKLLKEGIQPDIVVSVDSKHGSFDIGKDMLRLWENTLFVQAYHADNYLTAQWRGRAMYLGLRLPWKSRLNIESIKAAGPTVTQSSLLCAIEMEFAQIILCGVDHCYNKEGFTHAKNTDEHDIGPLLSNIGVTIATNGGWEAETKQEFIAGIHSIDALINYSQASGKECRFINPSANSAKIENIEFIKPDKLQVPQPVAELKRVCDLVPDMSRDEKQADLIELLDELKNMDGQIKEVKTLCKEALKLNEKAHKNLDIKSKNKVDKIEKKIHKKYDIVSDLIKTYNAAGFLKNSLVDSSREYDQEEIKKRVDEYFITHVDTADLLLTQIYRAISRVEARIEELSPEPDFDQIFELWKSDNTPGRVYILESYITNSQLTSNNITDSISHFKKLFSEMMSKSNTDFKKHITEKRDDLSGVKFKANILFNRKEVDRLEDLSTSIHKYKTGEQWENLGHLIDGYIGELQKDYDTAFPHFETLFESEYQTEALKHVLNVSLAKSDHESALLALECLSSSLPIYMPYYAEMLHLNNKHKESIDTYTEYLHLVPEDISAWIKLGKLYLDLNINDSAKWVFEQILIMEPGNTAANSYLNQITEPG